MNFVKICRIEKLICAIIINVNVGLAANWFIDTKRLQKGCL